MIYLYIALGIVGLLAVGLWAGYRIGKSLDDMEWEDD